MKYWSLPFSGNKGQTCRGFRPWFAVWKNKDTLSLGMQFVPAGNVAAFDQVLQKLSHFIRITQEDFCIIKIIICLDI